MTKTISHIKDWTIVHFDSIGSTNSYAKQVVNDDDVQKMAIMSEVQTEGYGRNQKNWDSVNNKGLWLSAIFPVNMDMAVLSQSTLVLAVAVRNAVQRVTSIGLKIKWPNDLLFNGKKCAGLLVEFIPPISGTTNKEYKLVLGIGLNVAQQAEDFSDTVATIATSLNLLTGKVFDKQQLLVTILEEIEKSFGEWQDNGFAGIRSQWLDHSCTIGRKVMLPDRNVEGRVIGLAMSGGLEVVTEDGAVLEVNSGEVLFKDIY